MDMHAPQAYGVASLGFDLTDAARWHPFILPGIYEPQPPRPFYSTGRIAPKLPAQRLAALTATLSAKLRAEYSLWRVTRSMRMRWSAKVQAVLGEGLLLLEAARCSSDPTAQIEVDKWRGRLMAATPPDHHFRGRALSFSTTDVDEIVEHIMGTYPYHEEGHRDAVFAIAVATFPHYCAARPHRRKSRPTPRGSVGQRGWGLARGAANLPRQPTTQPAVLPAQPATPPTLPRAACR